MKEKYCKKRDEICQGISDFLDKDGIGEIFLALVVMMFIGGFFAINIETSRQSELINQHPKNYLVTLQLKNDKVDSVTLEVRSGRGQEVRYTQKDKSVIKGKIAQFSTQNTSSLKQKQIPDSFPETIPEWKGKSVTIKVKWKNTKKVYRTVPVVTGYVILSNVYDDEETVDEGQFEKTFSNLK
jgi:hypothetical protein